MSRNPQNRNQHGHTSVKPEPNRKEIERLENILQGKENTIKRMSHWIDSLEIENKDLLEQEKKQRLKWQDVNEKLIYWRKRSFEQTQELEDIQRKRNEKDRLYLEQINEFQVEIKWHKRKVRVLEKALEKGNQTRLENQKLDCEKVKELTKNKAQLESELQKLITKRDDDECYIQNVQNTVRQLQMENERFRKKCGEPLPGVNVMENYKPPLSNRERASRWALLPTPEETNPNSTAAGVQRDFHCIRDSRRQAEIGNWPYSRADEIAFWNH